MHIDETKSAAGQRTIPLPRFAIEMLEKRRQLPYIGQQAVIFSSAARNNPGPEQRRQRLAPRPSNLLNSGQEGVVCSHALRGGDSGVARSIPVACWLTTYWLASPVTAAAAGSG